VLTRPQQEEELAQLQELYEQLPATLGNHQYLMADVSHSADSISCACSKVERSLDAVRLELQAATTSGWQALEQVIANGDRAELRMTLRTLIDRMLHGEVSMHGEAAARPHTRACS